MIKLYREKLAEIERKICVIYISSYIPRECGIATYTKDLTSAINVLNPLCLAEIMAVNYPESHFDYPWEVKFRFDQEDPKSYEAAADYINQSSAKLVNLQHEFGLFGGRNGEYILSLIQKIKKPLVTTFHTVLCQPSPYQEKIIKEIASSSKAIIVMIEEAAKRLVNHYRIASNKILVIHHGVPDMPYEPTNSYKKSLKLKDKIVLSTFGLMNRGKGIEYTIQALPKIIRKYPNILYLVIGETHPIVKKQEGEVYRGILSDLVKKLKISQNVKFVNQYLSLSDLITYLKATDIFLTPYLNPQQLTSGVLAYAVGAGKACISTPFLYAQQVLGNERGIIVNFKNSEEITKAVIKLLVNPEKKKEIEKKAYLYGRQMIWHNVALKHLDLFQLIIKENEK